ncbi:polysaccharide deacetylase family protein [Paenibacillus cymbidii]|uniref:polysaccharide deacetylase family protein n=1 Tax=Paenibacillus cymbidii TaxID=1639034 RepID=UPI00107FFA8A|nr:polysaccharide deacetylase family protein [Paenibacillus cymbidii]
MMLLLKLPLLMAAVLSLGLATSFSPSASKGREYYEQRGEVVWEVPTDRKVIALTFDDGPHPVHTDHILKLLKQYDAKATFFVVGNRAAKYPELVRRAAMEGHEIGNHTYTHPYFNRNRHTETMRRELSDTHDAIFRATGQPPHLFRPPGGYYNEAVVHMAKQSGYLVILWSWDQDTNDWRSPGTGRIVRKVLDHDHNGDIVLFHDFVEGRTQTVDALRVILPELKQRGYQFVTVSELLSMRKSVPVKKP